MLNSSASASSSVTRSEALFLALCLGFAAWLLRGAGALLFREADWLLPSRPPEVLEKKVWVVETAGPGEETLGVCLLLEAFLERAGGWEDIAVGRGRR